VSSNGPRHSSWRSHLIKPSREWVGTGVIHRKVARAVYPGGCPKGETLAAF